MKLWLIITENKYFVKILWHLLGECIKTTILLVCSTCTFFFQSLICALFSYISINYVKSGYTATVFCHCLYNVFHCSSTVQFWWVNLSFLFFKFWIVATVVTGFFFSIFLLYIFFLIYIYIYIVIMTQQISQYFHNYWCVNFL